MAASQQSRRIKQSASPRGRGSARTTSRDGAPINGGSEFKPRTKRAESIIYKLNREYYRRPSDAFAGLGEYSPLAYLPKSIDFMTTGTQVYGQGQTGVVRPLERIDRLELRDALIVKDFSKLDDEKVRLRNANCTIRLIGRRSEIRHSLTEYGLKRIANDPYLMGLPVFFMGGWRTMPGAQYSHWSMGYAAADLRKRGYVELAEYYSSGSSTERNRLLAMRRRRRVYMAICLAGLLAAFVRSNVRFIHGDIEPNNIMIRDGDDGELSLIDYDDGVFLETGNEKPRTLGNPDFHSWQDPIVSTYLNDGNDDATAPNTRYQADWWSLAVTAHYLIFGREPYFFLDAPVYRLDDYAAAGLWPNLKNAKAAYTARNRQEYDEYYAELQELKRLSPILYEQFEMVFNAGRQDIQARPHPRSWLICLRDYRQSLLLKPAVTVQVARYVLVRSRRQHAMGLLEQFYVPLQAKRNYDYSLPAELTTANIAYNVEHNEDAPASRIELWELAQEPLDLDSDDVAPDIIHGDRLIAGQDLTAVTMQGSTGPTLSLSRSGYYCLVVYGEAGNIYRPVGPFVEIDAPTIPFGAPEHIPHWNVDCVSRLEFDIARTMISMPRWQTRRLQIKSIPRPLVPPIRFSYIPHLLQRIRLLASGRSFVPVTRRMAQEAVRDQVDALRVHHKGWWENENASTSKQESASASIGR